MEYMGSAKTPAIVQRSYCESKKQYFVSDLEAGSIMSRYGRPPPDTSRYYIITHKQTRVMQYLSLRMTSLKVDGISSRTVVADLEYLFEK